LIAPNTGKDHRKISVDLVRNAHWQKILSPSHLDMAQLGTGNFILSLATSQNIINNPYRNYFRNQLSIKGSRTQ
jgi:hypothetical protein